MVALSSFLPFSGRSRRGLYEYHAFAADRASIWAKSDGTYLYFAAPLDGLIGRFDPLDATPVVDTIAFGLARPKTVRYVSAIESLYFLTSGTVDAEFRDGTLGVITGLR